jgi:hypothetical protein
VISVFDGGGRALFEGMAGLVWIDSRRSRACRRARSRQGRYAPLARWPEDGPSLTAAVRDGTGCVAGRGGRMVSIEQKDGTRRRGAAALPTSASGTLYSVREAELVLFFRTIIYRRSLILPNLVLFYFASPTILCASNSL